MSASHLVAHQVWAQEVRHLREQIADLPAQRGLLRPRPLAGCVPRPRRQLEGATRGVERLRNGERRVGEPADKCPLPRDPGHAPSGLVPREELQGRARRRPRRGAHDVLRQLPHESRQQPANALLLELRVREVQVVQPGLQAPRERSLQDPPLRGRARPRAGQRGPPLLEMQLRRAVGHPDALVTLAETRGHGASLHPASCAGLVASGAFLPGEARWGDARAAPDVQSPMPARGTSNAALCT